MHIIFVEVGREQRYSCVLCASVYVALSAVLSVVPAHMRSAFTACGVGAFVVVVSFGRVERYVNKMVCGVRSRFRMRWLCEAIISVRWAHSVSVRFLCAIKS